jgi:hypothetical protein
MVRFTRLIRKFHKVFFNLEKLAPSSIFHVDHSATLSFVGTGHQGL